jgi:hypothetical protein
MGVYPFACERSIVEIGRPTKFFCCKIEVFQHGALCKCRQMEGKTTLIFVQEEAEDANERIFSV